MSVAMQAAMLGHPPDAPMPPVPWPPTAQPPAKQAFRRLNARHRQHLIVRDLMQGHVLTPAAPAADHPKTTLTFAGAAPALELSLNRGDRIFWQDQIDTLHAMKWHRAERMEEIVLQQSEILSFLTLGLPVAGDTHPWLTVLLDAVFDMAFRVAAEMKVLFAMPRPNEWSSGVDPVIRTPSHGAFPSGHATEAFAAAAVLAHVFPDRTAHLRQMAARIATNRCYAGVHYPADQAAGALLGEVLGGLAVRRVFDRNPFVAPGTALSFRAGAAVPFGSVNPLPAIETLALGSPILTSAGAPEGAARPEALSILAELITGEL